MKTFTSFFSAKAEKFKTQTRVNKRICFMEFMVCPKAIGPSRARKRKRYFALLPRALC